ncbi:MAG: tail fiber assembly protein [Sutterella wadsworthensis]
MDFYIEKIFEGEYPPEAAVWCNERGDCYIEEMESLDGVRLFQIVAVPKPTDEDFAVHVRAERDSKIAETDYLAMPDYPLSDEDRAAVMNYRQALRDVPTQEGFPRNVVWPEAPAVFKRTKG